MYLFDYTSACCPGDSTRPHSMHLKQVGCQSRPSDVFLSAATEHQHIWRKYNDVILSTRVKKKSSSQYEGGQNLLFSKHWVLANWQKRQHISSTGRKHSTYRQLAENSTYRQLAENTTQRVRERKRERVKGLFFLQILYWIQILCNASILHADTGTAHGHHSLDCKTLFM